jgi:hypothetical protein
MIARRISRATLATILLLAGRLPAGADEPGRPTDADERLERILETWHQRSAKWTSLDVRFRLVERTPGQPDQQRSGRVVLQRDGRAMMEIGRGAKAEVAERCLWTRDEVHLSRMEAKTRLVWPMAAKDRGRLPAALALPFLWNVKPETLKSRYRCTLLKEDKEAWILGFSPLSDAGSRSLSKGYIQLDRTTYLPRRYYVIGPDGKSTRDYRVTSTRCDAAIEEEAFRPFDDQGWQVKRLSDQKLPEWLTRLAAPELLP